MLEKPLREGPPPVLPPVGAPPVPPLAQEKQAVFAAAVQAPTAWAAGGPPGVAGRARALWGHLTTGGTTGASVPLQQKLLPVENVRGALLLPAAHRQQEQQQQRQHSRRSPCNTGAWGYCMPASGGPFDLCCEGIPKPGVVLPPLRQRQRQGSRGPCARRRGPSGGPPPQLGTGGGLTASASAVALFPVLKPAAASASPPDGGRLMGSASAVDLSVVGRPLGVSRVPSNLPMPVYTRPPYGVGPHPPGRPQGGALLGVLPSTRRLQHRTASPSGGDRAQWGATTRSNSSSSSGKVFSRTKRSCSPIKERPAIGAPREPPARGAALGASHRNANVLSLESRVSPSAGEGREAPRLRAAPLPAKEHRGAPRPWALGGPQGAYPVQGISPSCAVTPPRELSPIGRPPSEWAEGQGAPSGEGTWARSNTRLAAAANQEALVPGAQLASPSSGMYMHAYSQPPRMGGPMTAVVEINHALLLQQRQQQQGHRQPSPFAFPPASPATAGNGAYLPSPVNACSPVQYRFIPPANGRPPPLSTVSVGRGGPLGSPSPGTSTAGMAWGPCGLISPLCSSNPPIKSPSTSSSNIRSIQRQIQKGEEGCEWMHARP